MINNVSWQGYWTAVALICGFYYLILYFKFFWNKSTVDNTRTIARSDSVPSNFASSIGGLQAGSQEKQPSSEEYSYQSCIDELKAFFEQARFRKWVPEELLFALQVICRKYDTLINTEFNSALNDFIITHAEEKCSIHLSSEEMDTVWLRK